MCKKKVRISIKLVELIKVEIKPPNVLWFLCLLEWNMSLLCVRLYLKIFPLLCILSS